MHACQQEIKRFLARRSLGKAKILVGLSGGPDSVALLRLLHREMQEDDSISLGAAHVNYRLRGKDSEDDEMFCRELCSELKVRLHRKRARKQPRSTNLQQWARRLRYDFFNELCERESYEYIAVGHNRDDNVETILMHLARGAGTFGMSGMAEMSGRIIRPLLNCPRADIEGFLEQGGFRFRIDKSNLVDKYLRNKVRKRLLPLLQELFGNAVGGNIHRAGSIFAEHESFLRETAGRELEKIASRTAFEKIVLDLTHIRQYHPLIARIMIALCFENLSGSLQEFEQAVVERVLGAVERGSGRVDLKSGISAEVCGDRLYFYHGRVSCRPIVVEIPGVTILKPFGLRLRSELQARSRISEKSLRRGKNRSIYLDADKLPRRLMVRTIRRGDSIKPLGMQGSKTLADFFVDRKVDRPLREEIPLLCSEAKQKENVVWVIGHEIADNYKVTERTRRLMKLEVRPYRVVRDQA